MKQFNLFSITSNSDTVEGKGYTITHGFTNEYDLARSIVLDKRFKKYLVMGIQDKYTVSNSINQAIINIYQTVDEFFDNTKEKIRQRALSKLTNEEREALGLD